MMATLFRLLAMSPLVTFFPAAIAMDAIEIQQLGRLSLAYQPVSVVQHVSFNAVNGQVSYLPGSEYQLQVPFMPFQIKPLVSVGQIVRAGEPILRLSGSEVHHFFEQLDAQQTLFELAKERYDNNLPLAQQQSISQQSWQTISNEYFMRRTELGHLQHAAEYLRATNDDDEAIFIAPIAGIVGALTKLADNETAQLGHIVPESTLRISASVPANQSNTVTKLATPNCTLLVAQRSISPSGLSQVIWSEPLTDNTQCIAALNQRVTVIPQANLTGYQVPSSSVFSMSDQAYVLVRSGNTLIATPVNLVQSNSNSLIVTSDADLSNAQVLTQSVSAVQGILLGLGGE